MKFTLKSIVALFIGSALLFSSCKKDEGTAPELPPLSSMSIDIETFEQDNANQRIAGDTTYVAAGAAALTMSFWNTVLVLNLATPVAAFKEAFNHVAVYDGDAKDWTWSYNFGVYKANKAELHGKVEGASVKWTMYITLYGKSQVVWYTGTSDINALGGTWSINKDVDDPKEYLTIAWTRTSDEVADIVYTYTYPDEATGSYIQYGEQTGEYDVFYKIYLAKDDKTTNIEFDRTTKQGHIKSTPSTEWACWNSSYIDVDCQ